MDLEIIKQNQKNLSDFKDAISNFVSPGILDNQMKNLKVLEKNIYESKQQKKQTTLWLKENKSNKLHGEYNSFFKRYEKCFNRIQEFQKKFSHNIIGLQLNDCKNLLTENFEAKANMVAQTQAIARANFCADMHNKTILIEAKYQKGRISADSAFEHISKLKNGMNNSDFSNVDENLKNLIGSYQNDYSTKAIFKNSSEEYLPDSNILSEKTSLLCKAEILNNYELQNLMSEATSTILELNKKLNISKVNNMLINSQEFISSFGSPSWNEKKATKFMDKFEKETLDLEALELEFESYQSKLADLVFEIQTKKEQAIKVSKKIAQLEAESRLNRLIQNIKEVKKLLKNKTPFEFLKSHYTILNNDYKEIELVLGKSELEPTLKKLSTTREELEDLNISINMVEALSAKEKSKDLVLEYKPERPNDKK